MGILTTIANALFSILTVAAAVILVAAPFLVRKQPAEKARKILLLSVVIAAAALVLNYIGGGISSIIQMIQWGADITAITSIIGQLIGNIFCVIYLAYPALLYMLKKQNNLIALTLILPIIPSFAQIIISALGGSLGMVSRIGAIVPGIFVGILMLLFFALALVWALTGRKPVLSKIVIIAAPVTFVLSFVLAFFANRAMYTRIGITTNFLVNFSGTANFFTIPLRLLIFAILGTAIHSLLSAAPVQSPYIGQQPIYPQPVQPAPYPVPAPVYNPPVAHDNSWMEDRTTVLPDMPEDPGTVIMTDEDATGILPEEKTCPVCGNPLQEGAAFCPICGHPLK